MNVENNCLPVDSFWLCGCGRHDYVFDFVQVFRIFRSPVLLFFHVLGFFCVLYILAQCLIIFCQFRLSYASDLLRTTQVYQVVHRQKTNFGMGSLATRVSEGSVRGMERVQRPASVKPLPDSFQIFTGNEKSGSCSAFNKSQLARETKSKPRND